MYTYINTKQVMVEDKLTEKKKELNPISSVFLNDINICSVVGSLSTFVVREKQKWQEIKHQI